MSQSIYDTAARERMLGFIREGKISHAYILTGPVGSGKQALAAEAAAALVCRGKNPPCGICPQCEKAFGGTHQDIHSISDGAEGKSIGVDRVREIGKSAYIAPGEAARAVYIIDCAEKMTVQAQNALLKVLEEPPEPVVFFLLTANLLSLLPTVRSRAAIVRLTPPSVKWTAERLSSLYPERSKKELGEAAAFGADADGGEKQLDSALQQIDWAPAFFETLTRGNRMAFLAQYTRLGKNKAALVGAAETAQKFCADMLRAKEDEEEGWFFEGQAERVRKIASGLTKKKVIALYSIAAETGRLLNGTYSNVSLAAIVFLNQYWEETH